MIIVEGADLVGKTTLCKELVRRSSFDLAYNHLSRLPESFHRFYDYLELIKPSNVFDRFHMSEIAYIAARREKQGSTNFAWYAAIDRMIIDAAGMIIIVTADEPLIRSRMRDDEMYDMDTILRANEAFLTMATENEFQGFCPYKSFHVHCTEDHPFVEEDQIEFFTIHHEALINRHAFVKAHKEF